MRKKKYYLSLIFIFFFIALSACGDNKEAVAKENRKTSLDDKPSANPSPCQIAFYSDSDGGDFEPDLFVMNADGSNVIQLTSEKGFDYEPKWSPDGSRIAFRSDRDGDFHIYTIAPNGSDLMQLTRDDRPEHDIAWSPDSAQIAFVSDIDGDDEIYVMDADGDNIQQLTYNTSDDNGPVWSPNGALIAFTSDRAENTEIFTIEPSGNNEKQITFDSYKGDDGGLIKSLLPVWFPDSSRLLFKVERGSPSFPLSDIQAIDIDGRSTSVVAGIDFKCDSHALSPDGTKIAFDSKRDETTHIFVMNADGSDVQQLTFSEFGEYSPVWSPGGSRIVYTSSGGDEFYHLFVMDADGSNNQQLTLSPPITELGEHEPVWSPFCE